MDSFVRTVAEQFSDIWDGYRFEEAVLEKVDGGIASLPLFFWQF